MSQMTPADRWTYAFYGGGALAALVGQVWAAADHIPFPDSVEPWARAVIVAPAVAVIEVGGVAMAARGDLRRQLGETALGYRVLSACVALFAVLFNWFGHQSNIWLAFFFAGFSALAYAVWLLQSGDRRRDALRGAEKVAETAPSYGLLQWVREYAITRRARTIAQETGAGLYESLRLAREERRREERRQAISAAVAAIIRDSQKDKRRAAIAVTTYDMEALAEQIEARADYAGWADLISASLVPAGAIPTAAATPEEPAEEAEPESVPDKPVSAPPSTPKHPLTAKEVAKVVARHPDWKPRQIATRLGIGETTVRRYLAQIKAAETTADSEPEQHPATPELAPAAA